MVRKTRFWFIALFLLAGLTAQPAAAATVFYDVYAGTGTTGTLLLGFQVPNLIPTSPPGEAIADVIGSEASFFPAGTDAIFMMPLILIPNGQNLIQAARPADDINVLGQFSVGLAANNVFVALPGDATLVVSNTAPAVTPLPATLPLFATGLGALGLLGWRRKRKARVSLLGAA